MVNNCTLNSKLYYLLKCVLFLRVTKGSIKLLGRESTFKN